MLRGSSSSNSSSKIVKGFMNKRAIPSYGSGAKETCTNDALFRVAKEKHCSARAHVGAKSDELVVVEAVGLAVHQRRVAVLSTQHPTRSARFACSPSKQALTKTELLTRSLALVSHFTICVLLDRTSPALALEVTSDLRVPTCI